MKKILLGLLASLLVVSLSAQVNLLKNGNMEEQGEWNTAMQDAVLPPILFEFVSTANTVNGGDGGNLAITYTPDAGQTTNQNLTVYQALDMKGGEEYLWSCAMRDLSSDGYDCWWIKYVWVALEPTDGSDPDEQDIAGMHEWLDGKILGFDGLFDTCTAAIAAESKTNIFVPEADGIYYVGINMGNCSAAGKYEFIIDEIAMIDQDAEPIAVEPQYDNKGNSLSVYPNPARTTINLTYTIRENSDVKLSVINMLGQEVATVSKESKAKGTYTERFDCSNLTDGMYYGLLKVGNTLVKKKIMVLK